MPEGHTIHRLAQDHRALLVGAGPLTMTSPQGWPAAAEAVAVLDGGTVRAIDAYGKHLLYRFDGVDEALHVHLGLFGRFRTFTRQPWPEPRPTTRLRIEVPGTGVEVPGTVVEVPGTGVEVPGTGVEVPGTGVEVPGTAVLHLSGATASGLLSPPAEDALLARLGPDPLRRDDPDGAERFKANLARRRIPIGAALMDQRVVAGVGNAYRAEALLACGLDPQRPARTLDDAEVQALWDTIADQLRRGVKSRRITPRKIYRRRRCGVCGGSTEQAELAARTLHWCPTCQPAAP